ncbi:twitching motility protein PilT [Geomonas silvestris]|uniref:Twitching motility protein PilT n=1 Tax=Geomonas silvestris TaxID=2740184 RepID=A0A6V8MM91_9BACT|nr:AbrB/MazE/SpoVT family DNA-binding domain-containing protein [Geomonas silvestris]GFO61165.1 twitching motility protein PilT [Geomonas silvestris]
MNPVVERHVRLFKNGKNQALRIPREFELPGDEAVIRKEGDRLIIEPAKTKSLLALISTWQPTEEGLADHNEGLLPLEDVDL